MSPSSSLLGRSARVLLSPLPTTLVESTSIFKRLQYFGAVESFLNPRYNALLQEHAVESQPSHSRSLERSESHLRVENINNQDTSNEVGTFLAVFDSHEALQSACRAGRILVEVGHDAVDVTQEDPYNIRRLRDRKPVSRKTFTCQVMPDTDANSRHINIVKSNPQYQSFQVGTPPAIVVDMEQAGASIEGLATVRAQITLSNNTTHQSISHSHVSIQSTSNQTSTPLGVHQSAILSRAPGFAPAEPDGDQALLTSIREKRAEKHRLKRAKWRNHKERKLLEVQAKQAQMHRELMQELDESDLDLEDGKRKAVENASEGRSRPR